MAFVWQKKAHKSIHNSIICVYGSFFYKNIKHSWLNFCYDSNKPVNEKKTYTHKHTHTHSRSHFINILYCQKISAVKLNAFKKWNLMHLFRSLFEFVDFFISSPPFFSLSPFFSSVPKKYWYIYMAKARVQMLLVRHYMAQRDENCVQLKQIANN